MQVTVGEILDGKVAKVTNYGAFVDLQGGGSGMIHISEVANTYVKDINNYLKVGDEVKVKVIGINPENKVSLSIKETMELAPAQAEAPPPRSPRPQGQSRPPAAPRSFNRPAAIPSTGDSFEDMMNRYKKSSDDRMGDLKKIMDTRRGSYNRRSKGR